MKPIVSIITPTFNSEKYIAQTIESIQSQTFEDWELIVADDASNDSTLEIVREYEKRDSRIKTLKNKNNHGAGITRNRAIKSSKGRYIAFCDSDDLWKPTKLKKQLEFMNLEGLAFTFSSYDLINEKGFYKKQIICPKELDYKKILRNNYVGCLTAIYDTNKLGKRYFKTIRKRQDWVLWIEILRDIHKTKGLTESLARYRKLNNSLSFKKYNLIVYNWSVYNKILEFSFIKSLYCMLIFFLCYFGKKIK